MNSFMPIDDLGAGLCEPPRWWPPPPPHARAVIPVVPVVIERTRDDGGGAPSPPQPPGALATLETLEPRSRSSCWSHRSDFGVVEPPPHS